MDKIAEMITTLKNGSKAGKDSVFLPYSKVKHSILVCLEKEGYVGAVSKKTKKGLPVLEVVLMYKDNKPKVTEVQRVSKPSKRVYFGVKDIHSVRSGDGLLVLSTPKGILGGREAKKEQVGGEVLFKVW